MPDPAPIPANPTPPGPVPHPAAQVGADRVCIRCSYNLRGLPTDGRCPECGTPVADSLRGDYLAFAAPEHLASIRAGLDLVLVGVPVYFVALVGGLLGGLAVRGILSPPEIGVLRHAAMLAPSALLLAGYWRLTRPEPGHGRFGAPTSARRVIRVAAVLQAAASGADVLASPFVPGGAASGAMPAVLVRLADAVFVAAALAWVAQFFAVMSYVGWLGRRVPDRKLVEWSETYSWALPLLFVLGAVVLLLAPVAAVAMYWSLLDRLRKKVRSIQRRAGSAPV